MPALIFSASKPGGRAGSEKSTVSGFWPTNNIRVKCFLHPFDFGHAADSVHWVPHRLPSGHQKSNGSYANERAVLAETVRIDGKPRQKHVAFIASYETNKLDQISTRSTFWRAARQRLDQIGSGVHLKYQTALKVRTETVYP